MVLRVSLAEREEKHARATTVVVENSREALADLAAAFYQRPARRLKMAGVTGTNGKTTTTFLIKHICEKAGLRCGLIGTVRYEIGERILPAIRTTPESLEVQELLAQIAAAGCKAAAMEVSSHALAQERTRGLEWDVAVFTNLTQDHLDFHGTMENYFEAKAKLFTGLAGQTSKKKNVAVINADDHYGQLLINRIGKKTPVVTYGMGVHADFRASNYRMEFGGTSYQLDARGKSYLVRVPLIGRFNVANSMAALAAANSLGVNLREAILSLGKSPQVPGRLESVPAKRQFQIFVDYAHSDDALLNVLKTLRDLGRADSLLSSDAAAIAIGKSARSWAASSMKMPIMESSLPIIREKKIRTRLLRKWKKDFARTVTRKFPIAPKRLRAPSLSRNRAILF